MKRFIREPSLVFSLYGLGIAILFFQSFAFAFALDFFGICFGNGIGVWGSMTPLCLLYSILFYSRFFFFFVDTFLIPSIDLLFLSFLLCLDSMVRVGLFGTFRQRIAGHHD